MVKYKKIWPPAIPYKPLPKKGKKMTKTNTNEDDTDTDEEDTRYWSFEVKFDPDNKESDGYMQKVAVFEDGHPEDWVKWCKEVKELFKVLGYDDKPPMQHKVYQSLLVGKTLEYYNDCFNRNVSVNLVLPDDKKLSDAVVLQCTLNDVAKKIFPNWEIAFRAQKAYMHKCLVMGDENPESFKD